LGDRFTGATWEASWHDPATDAHSRCPPLALHHVGLLLLEIPLLHPVYEGAALARDLLMPSGYLDRRVQAEHTSLGIQDA